MRRWLGFIGLVSITLPLCTLSEIATASPPASAMEWRITAPTNWVGDGQQPVAFLNVATDDAGNVYVANFSSALVFDGQTGALQHAIVDSTRTVVQYDDVEPVGDGTIWVADSKSFLVHLLAADGTVVRSIPPTIADSPDSRMAPNELEIGPDGNLYVMYSSAHTVMQVFTPDGGFVRSFDMGDSKLSTGLNDFAFGPDGNLYIAGVSTVRVFDVEGVMVTETFAPDFVAASTAGIHGITVDLAGNVYVGGNAFADDGSLVAAIYKLDASGQVVAQFGHAQQRPNWGSEVQPEELGFTVSMSILPEGQFVISDLNGAYSQLLRVTMAG